ncbi:hypothetical protein G6011_01416 [Alternaria panax]|uniref:Uncharacterized protein n=1 Tax=Alternaria panax TaxID=48097 RepID=A0AAD4IKS8_9PLEO|nr:hypothetical protein G6011_01416 [Alternaria panax]
MSSSPQRHTPSKGRVIGGGMTGNYSSPHRGSRNVRFQTSDQFGILPSVVEASSHGSASTDSFSSSGGSLSQLGPDNAADHRMTALRGQVNNQMSQAKQQLPTTPQRVHRMAADGNGMTSFVSPVFTSPQTTQQYDDSAQKKSSGVDHFNDSGMQRRISHASQTPDNWRSSGRRSFSSDRRSSTMANPVDTSPPSMTNVPEYLAVQAMAFRQGQYDCSNSLNRIPPSPFAKHLDHIWAQYYKMGAAYRGAPVTPLVASSPSHDNFAWSVLINPATQDLEHPNGSIDIEWARKMCLMSLDCMKELIHVVRERHNDWRKIVCDIPLPVQQTILAFPDLCEYYEALQHEAHQAFGNGL